MWGNLRFDDVRKYAHVKFPPAQYKAFVINLQ
jgi:hypothetical protein